MGRKTVKATDLRLTRVLEAGVTLHPGDIVRGHWRLAAATAGLRAAFLADPELLAVLDHCLPLVASEPASQGLHRPKVRRRPTPFKQRATAWLNSDRRVPY